MSDNTQDLINDKGLETLNEIENKQTEDQFEQIETHASENYDASNIRVLEGLEAVGRTLVAS